MFSVLDSHFSTEQDDFPTEAEAIQFIIDELSHEDYIYVVMQGGFIICFVHGGEVYRAES